MKIKYLHFALLIIFTVLATISTIILLKGSLDKQNIVSANFLEIRKYLVSSSIKNSNLQKHNANNIDKFEHIINQISQEKNIIILDKKVIMGDAKDITLDIKNIIDDLYEKK